VADEVQFVFIGELFEKFNVVGWRKLFIAFLNEEFEAPVTLSLVIENSTICEIEITPGQRFNYFFSDILSSHGWLSFKRS